MPPQVQVICESLFEELIDAARSSPRRRINYNFHESAADNPHRFLNVFLRGSYVAPHRHLNPPKCEAFLVLSGVMAVFVFSDTGGVEASYLLSSELPSFPLPSSLAGAKPSVGIDLAAGLWHTVVVLSPHAVCYEVKPGPWDPATDKEFAPWAPPEGDPASQVYLEALLR